MGSSIKEWVAEQTRPNGEVIAELAEAVGVSPAAVRHWISGQRQPPPTRCAAIEKFTDGKVTRHALRPDVYGEPPAAANDPLPEVPGDSRVVPFEAPP